MLNSKIKGKGEVVCILHGLFGSLDNWFSMSNLLSSDFEVHCIDNRNHGNSFHSEEHNYEVMVEDFKEYLDAHNLTKINLVGHSMGGKVAMIFSSIYPYYINKLAVIDIAPKIYPNNFKFILDSLLALDLKKYKKRQEIENHLYQILKDKNLTLFLIKNAFLNKKGFFEWKFNLSALERNINNICDFKEDIKPFRNNTLFIKGENSNYIREEDKKYLDKYFSNYTIDEIKKVSHFVHIENKMACYNSLLNFFS